MVGLHLGRPLGLATPPFGVQIRKDARFRSAAAESEVLYPIDVQLLSFSRLLLSQI
jgi:hypothetical protein